MNTKTTVEVIAPKSDVRILPLDGMPGRVNAVKLDNTNDLIYNVAYFCDGAQRFIDLWADQIDTDEK